jgi:hypothetical protein
MTRHKIAEELVLYRCDCCGRTVELDSDDTLHPPWRGFSMGGWIGKFIACSDICEERYLKGKCHETLRKKPY